jgi:malonate transporter and related proteins
MIQTILGTLAPIAVTMLLGFTAAWRHDFGPGDASVLNRMVLSYAVPIALFVGTIGTSRSALVADVPFAVAICVAIVGLYGLVFLVFRFAFRSPLSESALAALIASSPAAPFMGPAVLGGLFGKAGAVSIAIAALVINLVVVPGTLLSLAMGRPVAGSTSPSATRHSNLAAQIWETVKEPMVWAPVLAFALVLFGVSVPSLLSSGLSLLGQASSGVALFASGIMLAAYKIKIDVTVLSLVFLKSIVQPALVFIGLLWLGVSASTRAEAVLTAAIPTMPIVIVLSVQYHVSETRCSSAVLLGLVGLIFTMPAFIALTQ